MPGGGHLALPALPAARGRRRRRSLHPAPPALGEFFDAVRCVEQSVHRQDGRDTVLRRRVERQSRLSARVRHESERRAFNVVCRPATRADTEAARGTGGRPHLTGIVVRALGSPTRTGELVNRCAAGPRCLSHRFDVAFSANSSPLAVAATAQPWTSQICTQRPNFPLLRRVVIAKCVLFKLWDCGGRLTATCMARAGETMFSGTFSTQSLPPSEQFEAWHGWYGPVFEAVSLASAREGFASTNDNWTVGGFTVSRVESPPNSVARAPSFIRRNPVDHWVITLSKQS